MRIFIIGAHTSNQIYQVQLKDRIAKTLIILRKNFLNLLMVLTNFQRMSWGNKNLRTWALTLIESTLDLPPTPDTRHPTPHNQIMKL
jgi:hypothetical protein